MSSLSLPVPQRPETADAAAGRSRLRRAVARPELLGLMALTGVLNLWNLSVDGFANTYYAAAVRSMAGSWHDFLFASMDPSGLMTVDKPPLSLWVQALSVRIFGLHPLAILVPEALMGVAAVALLADLVRRRFGRLAGFVGGLGLAITPIAVAMSRHNNPDELLALCSVAAVWATLRGLETGRARWLAWAGVAIGLGFETKMAAALLIVPGLALAWLWVAPHGRRRALAELLGGGVAMAVVGGAWPLMVTLTAAADRPWISGTSDNSVWSLIFGYNGIGRLAGQTGGPPGAAGGTGPAFAGAGGGPFGGGIGILRLLNDSLGSQAGWLLGLAMFGGLALLGRSRLRRDDPRTGWLLAVGGAFATCAVAFSFASGIFHPYYVVQLAPFAAALVGAGVAEILRPGGKVRGLPAWRLLAAGGLLAGAASELAVLGTISGRLSWATPLVIAACGLCLAALLVPAAARFRTAVVPGGLAALAVAPAVWAAQTVSHSLSTTFPAGGPSGTGEGGPGGGAPGRGFAGRFAGGPPAGFVPGGLSGAGGPPPGFAPGAGGPPGPRALFGARGRFGGFGAENLSPVLAYVRRHGGGTVGVASQSSAASAIVDGKGNVAGLGGFSGRESAVSVSWLAGEVAFGRLRWLVLGASGGFGLPGDTRSGSTAAFTAAARACKHTTVASGTSGSITLLDCAGRAGALTG